MGLLPGDSAGRWFQFLAASCEVCIFDSLTFTSSILRPPLEDKDFLCKSRRSHHPRPKISVPSSRRCWPPRTSGAVHWQREKSRIDPSLVYNKSCTAHIPGIFLLDDHVEFAISSQIRNAPWQLLDPANQRRNHPGSGA
jgi:hypothetical protein